MIRSILGGVFIALGALASAGLPAPINGIVFASGLLSILFGNCLLFTGAVLRVTEGISLPLLSDWLKIFIGNFIGCFILVQVILHSSYDLTVVQAIAERKAEFNWIEAFLRAIPCNFLVCLAVLNFRHLQGVERVIMVIFPIMVFVVCGFEHSVANMFYYSFSNFNNLLAVTLGNIIGGCITALCFVPNRFLSKLK